MVFCKEIPIGKISRGERVFNLKLILSYDTEREHGVSMSLKYNGTQYNIRDRLDCFFRDLIMPSGEITRETLNNIYLLVQIFLCARSNKWDMSQNLEIVKHEIDEGFTFGDDDYDIKTYLCSVGMDYSMHTHKRFSFPDEGLEFRFNLPGIGDAYESISKFFGHIEDADYMNAIGTAG